MLQISSWEDWFKNCDAITPMFEKYEQLILKYYDLYYSTKQETLNKRREAFENRHRCKFYTDLSLIPNWKIISTILYGILSYLVGIILFFTILFFKPDILNKDVELSIVEKLKISAIDSIYIFLGVVFLLLFIYVIRVFLLRSKINKQENLLKERIQYIPPRYRNSTCTKYLYEAHILHNIPYDIAIENCDEYIRSNNLVANYMSIMFDEPVTELALESQYIYNNKPENDIPNIENNENNTNIPIEENWNTIENLDIDIPNLPEDIKLHTFKGVPNADVYLNSMIGLNNIKDTVRKMKNRMSFYSLDGGNQKISGNNMVFLGSPGTGKSTVARVLTSILSEFGYIKGNYCIEIDGNYLKSAYSGQSAEITTAIIQYCEKIGAVLFIDEAYTLLNKNGKYDESLTILLQAMEQKKDSLVVIFAGYEDDINRLLASNQGFASRIKHKLYFEDYTEDELLQIFKQMMNMYSKNINYEISDIALSYLRKQFSIEKQSPGFGNARVVRNALDRILDIHADRFMRGEISEENKYILEEQDIIEYIKERKIQLEEDRRNYIANNDLDSSIITMSDLKVHTKPGSENPEQDLNNLIGLNTIKEEVKQLESQYNFYNGNIENFGHCLFIGPSGTGKTTVAKILTGYLYNLGIISENRFFDCTGAYLQGSYVGHTAKRTEAICQYSTGGVLFIDEAYSLLGSEGKPSDYGSEAVAVLIDFMEKNRNNFVIIFAGYEKEMNQFLNANTGIKSRITNVFHFNSYTPYEMANIMNTYAHNDGFKVETECWEPIQYYFLDESKKPNFGNARTVRNIWEQLKKQHIYNFAQSMYNNSYKYIITKKDILDILGENYVKIV